MNQVDNMTDADMSDHIIPLTWNVVQNMIFPYMLFTSFLGEIVLSS